jgi:hypothetical protein
MVCWAQTDTASLAGVIEDASGGVVAGAKLRAEEAKTGLRREAVSDTNGAYRLAFLPPGEYQLVVDAAGFRPMLRSGLVLRVGQDLRLDMRLEVGSVDERVSVTADPALVEINSVALSQVVDERRVRELPLNGRDIVQLIQFQPGVHAARNDPGDITTGSKGTRVTVAGARPSTNVYLLDGTVINNIGNRTAAGATGSLTGVETIQEFRAYTNGYSAEFSRAAGGAFQIITKSGSNEWHGSAFAFARNDNVDARNYFDAVRPEFQRQQFGGSLGGRVVRDRTFFFGSYEGYREKLGQTITRTVPEATAAAVAASVRPYLALWPKPTSDPVPGDGAALYTTVFSRPLREDFANVRLDHRATERDTLFVRYTMSDSSQMFLSDEVFPQFANRLSNRPQFATLQWTRSLGARAVNEARAGFARSNPMEVAGNPDLHRDLAFVPGEGLGVIAIGGFDAFGQDRSLPRRVTQNSYQLSDQLTWQRGRHQWSFGAQLERLHYNVNSSSLLRGEFRFNTLTDFLRGNAATFEGMLPGARDFIRGYRQTLFGWYAQDAWRVHRRLVLHLGIRHEFVTEPTEQHGRLNNLRHYTDRTVTLGTPFSTQKTNVAPRVGFAWDPRGDQKWAVRGGGGLFYVPFLANQWWNSIVRLPPYAITARATGAAASFPNAIAGLAALGRDSVSAVDENPGQPYMMQFNLNVQRELLGRTLLTLGYVGSRGVDLGREADFNIGAPGNATRRNPSFARIRWRTWDARSFYNSLQAGLQRHYRNGFQWQASYTYAKSIDEASGELGRSDSINGQARTADPFDRRRDRALSSFDVRHNLWINGTWESARRWNGVAGLLWNDWQWSGIASFSTGIPFTPILIADLDGDGTDDNEQRPNVRPGYTGRPVSGRPEQWFDPRAFQSIERGTRGNLGRNTIGGPGLATVDVGLSRKFAVPRWEGAALQVRVEGFNVLNRANFATPPRTSLEIFTEAGANAAPLPNVGRITSTATPARQFQFALRLSF